MEEIAAGIIMDQSSVPLRRESPQSQGLARFACDYCRIKKFKCSRELPKCSNCQRWPGPCQYSHTIHGRKKKNGSNRVERVRSAAQVAIEQRLQRLETNLGLLASGKHDPPAGSQTDSGPQSSSIQDQDPSSDLPAFTQIKSDLESIRVQLSALPGNLDGQNCLQNLSADFSRLYLESDQIRSQAKEAGRSKQPFCLLNTKEGEYLRPIFLAAIERGKPLYFSPPAELLHKIIYEPQSVVERGWVVFFSCTSLAAIPSNDPQYSDLKAKLRWNTWLSLDDSSVFLEPSHINIISLMTAACHGEDFVTPNLSWILVGHAVRLAQAMRLHMPSKSLSPELNKQRSLIFWGLFAVEKSVSLAFRRPSAFGAAVYDHVPLPDASELCRFEPHRQSDPLSPFRSSFGSTFFLKAIRLAKMMWKVSDLVQNIPLLDASLARVKVNGLKEELSEWHRKTVEELRSARDSECPHLYATEVKEMDLGITSMTFQYYHMQVLLTRHEVSEQEFCLESARNAIRTLEGLVSTSAQVYNGIVWQLLYFPFTPFFVLFSIVSASPLAASSMDDLELLRATVSYFVRMSSVSQMAVKLQKIAQAFVIIAENCIQNARGPEWPQRTTQIPRLLNSTGTSTGSSGSPSDPTGMQMQVDNGDIQTFFNLLYPNADPSLAWHESMSSVVREPLNQSQQARLPTTSDTPEATNSFPKSSLDPVLECDFDWFTWDSLI